jgi:hypothetical protein
MSQFEVSLPAVDALSFRVGVAGSDAQSAAGQLRANACYATGSSALDGALSEFQQFWDSFTQASASDVDTTAATIAAAAAAYHQVDTTVMVDPALTSAFMRASMGGG